MTRSISRIVPLALAIVAVAAPGASASPADPGNWGTAEPVAIDKVSPDARDAGRPVAVDRVSPDARDNGRREPAPIVQARGTDVAAADQQAPTTPVGVPVSVPQADGFDWADAGLGAGALALLAAAAGTAVAVRTRRRPVRAS